jgi:3-deoxy-D-manno-octulosonic-acid transferase
MYLAYSLLLTLGLIVLIPHFLYQAFAHGKYIEGLRQRLGSLPQINNSSKPVIWLHCVSVGETQAARPLVSRLRSEFPDHFLLISTITTTGQTLAQDVFRNQADAVVYFPFDWTWTVRRAFKAIKPDVVLIMETELWPNFLRECGKQNVPVALVNGRISVQSFRRYQLVRFFLRKVLSHLSIAVMQSDNDAKRIATLGMPNEKLFVSGNLKFDVDTSGVGADSTEIFRKRFDIKPEQSLILAASTHGPEEKIIIKSFLALRDKHYVRLVIAPRRPERFQEVANLIDGTSLISARRSKDPHDDDAKADIILLDTIGELPAIYGLCRVVFVGGSIVNKGGHNVLEPAMTGVCIVTGHHTDNFQAIVELLVEANAIVHLPTIELEKADQVLTRVLGELLSDGNRRSELGKHARQTVQQNQGAADRTLSLLKPLFRHTTLRNASCEKALATNSSHS